MLVSMKEYTLSKIAYVFGLFIAFELLYMATRRFCFVPGASSDFLPDYREKVLP